MKIRLRYSYQVKRRIKLEYKKITLNTQQGKGGIDKRKEK